MKKILLLLLTLSFLMFGGACFTPLVYKDQTQHYQEEISSFLITKDGKKLIVIGKEYHYIFPADDTLKFVSTWSNKAQIRATFSSFNIKTDQTLSGTYTFSIGDQRYPIVSDIKQLLTSKGFEPHEGLKNRMTYKGQLQGTRYLIGELEIPQTLKLRKTYQISMIEKQVLSASEVTKRILLTPLALSADGIIILGGVIVSPFVLLSLAFD
ncbi:MAG: hypothetical protein KAG10_09135 [Methylococcales bacterium]|nr:hypothetical protein [Methylococcales bacterium]MCK5926043.1 hypothetical protein [Methylococcales bacterium]